MRSFGDSPPHVPRWHGCVARCQTLMPTTWDGLRCRTSTRESRASLVPVVEAGRLRMLSVLSIFLAMWLVGCGGTAAVPAGTASAPAPFVERVHPDFWSAVAALDFDGAGRLAENTSQREFLDALRDVAEVRLVEAQMKLLALARSADADIVARSTELLFLVLRERPSSAIESLAPRSWRALIRAWRDMSSRESWAFPPHPVTHPLQHRAGVPLVPVTVNGRTTAFALDTGAWRTVLSSRFAAAASVSTSPVEMTIEGAHGVAMRALLATADVDLGGIRIQGHPVAVLDAAMLEFPLGRTSPVEFDGVLGWNAIRELRITLDNDRRVLVFEPPRHGATSRSEFVWIGKPFVRARAENGLPLALFLDTANTGSVIAQALAGAAGFRGGRYGEMEVAGAGGTRRVQATAYAGAVLHVGGERIRFGELLARSLRASPPLGSIDGILGSDALTSGRVVIDFQAGEFSISGAR
jgi:Aspartyl protease